jgi:ABC-type branched-subunit amino acid transport system substrate-binding protein
MKCLLSSFLVFALFAVFLISSLLAFSVFGSSSHRICCLLPLDNDNKILSENVLKGLSLGLNILNKSSSFSISVYNSKGSPEVAFSALRDMKTKNCKVVVSLLGKNTAKPVLAKAYQERLPTIALTAESDIIIGGGFIYRDFITPQIQIENLFNFVTKKLAYSSFVVMYPQNEYGQKYLKLFIKEIAKRGGEIVRVVKYRPETSDFGPQIKAIIGKKIAEANPEDILKKPPSFSFDAIVILDNALTSGFIISQFAYYNAKNLVFLGTTLWDVPKFAEMIKGYCNAAYFPTGFTLKAKEPWVKQFIDDFIKAYHSSPDYLSAQGYEVGRIFLYLKRFNLFPPKDLDEIIQNFPGVTGLTTFLPDGEVSKKIYIMKIKDGYTTLASQNRCSKR